MALSFLVNTCSPNFSTFLIVLSPVTFNSSKRLSKNLDLLISLTFCVVPALSSFGNKESLISDLVLKSFDF